jgi:predicted transcriptional regulator
MHNSSHYPEGNLALVGAVSTAPLPDLQINLLKRIEQNPGIRYRELARLTGLVNGVLSYHLALLQRSNLIVTERQPGQTRLFPTSVSADECMVLKHLRNKPQRELVIALLKREMCTFNELVEYTGKAQSTVSGHLKKLRETAIISVRYGQQYHLYHLTNRVLVGEVLSKFKASFADRVIDNFAEMVEQF